MANVDLSYLNEISGGDKEFIDEMINTFLEETPKDLAAIKEHSDSSNWTEVGKTAHKLKSSIKMFGLGNLKDEVLDIEMSGKNNQNVDLLAGKVETFIAKCHEAMEELKLHL
ncbi:MAG: Hpt domain-containing protein [Bacteroidetes bacterium]|nr:Hpt domain-containing protein [Bacteroidota bacterium]